jgi:ubiquinone/menaquinone biosynthesis C-methylase UbiE
MNQNIEREFWDNAAKDPNVDTKYISDLSTEECLNAVGFWAGDVLEIGCGVGRLMRPNWCGVDISSNMLDIASERKPDCHFRLTDGRTIPYDDEVFRAVYSVLVFQHLDEDGIKAYIKEAYRVLEILGTFRFQFVEGNEHEPFSQHYPLSKIKEWLEEAGFKIETVDKGLVHYQWVWLTCQK